MQIKAVVVGPIQTNCYIVVDEGECIVVDPGASAPLIADELGELRPTAIVVTHAHWDHTGGVPELASILDVPVLAYESDAPNVYQSPRHIAGAGRMPRECAVWHEKAVDEGKAVDRLLKEGDEVTVGNCVFTVIHTPGHTCGSMCLYCAEEKVLIAGDTLFAGGRYGRTDFATGSAEDMVRTLQEKFVGIPDDVVVLSGHEQSSVMGRERKLNPHLR